MGSSNRCAELANQTREDWRAKHPLPQSLRDLRCCLFFEQRQWHHHGYGFDEEAMRYARDLISAIRLARDSRARERTD